LAVVGISAGKVPGSRRISLELGDLSTKFMIKEVNFQPALPRSFLAAVLLLGICFWREGVEAALGPEQRG
jgi:hypothetical protein